MKPLHDLPTDFKVQDPEKVEGTYSMPHPWIKDTFIVMEASTKETVQVTIMKKISAKALKAADRYPTYVELSAVRRVFFLSTEKVMVSIEELDVEPERKTIELVRFGEFIPE